MAAAKECNEAHQAAHACLEKATEEAAVAQEKAREAARVAADAENKAITAANIVRQKHLVLGRLRIGTFLCPLT